MTRALVDTLAQYPNYHAEKSKQVAHISSSALAAKREKHGISASSISPGRAPSLSDSRPGTATRMSSLPSQAPEHKKPSQQVEQDKPRTLAPVTSRRGLLSTNQSAGNLLASANQAEQPAMHEGRSSAEAPMSLKVRASRGVAIRGELGFPSPTNPLDENAPNEGYKLIARPKTSAGFVSPLLERIDPDSLQSLTLSTRPRSRFARRESSRWQAQVRTLERITTTPVLSQPGLASSRAQVGTQSAVELGSVESARLNHQPQFRLTDSSATSSALATAWDEGDIANFFLTELDKAEKQKDYHEETKREQKARKKQLAVSIADAWYLLYGFQQWEIALGRVSDAIAAAEALDKDGVDPTYTPLIGLLHHHAGIALKELGRTKLAIAAQNRALKSALNAHDRRLQARVVKALGVLLLDGHDMQSALEHQQEALSIALEEKDRDLEARVYANLGNIAAEQQRFGHAIACHGRDLRLSQSPLLNSAVGVVRAHRNLAVVYGRLHKRDLQQQHEAKAQELEEGARAFELDVENHALDGTGNPASQLSVRDAELVELIAESLRSAIDSRREARRRSWSSASRESSLDDGSQLRGISPTLHDSASAEVASRPKRSSVTLRINNCLLE